MIQQLLKKGAVSAALLAAFQIGNAQQMDPCGGEGPGCQNGGGNFVMTSDFSKFVPNQPDGFFIGVGDKGTGKIDTSFTGNYTVTKITGPGNITGTGLTGSIFKYAYIPDFKFDAPGLYEIEVAIPGIGKDTLKPDIKDDSNNNGGGETFDPCTGDGPGCQNGGGDMVLASELDKAVVNQPNQLIFGAGSKSTMKLDTSYSGTYTLTKVNGPGNMTGTLTSSFAKFANVGDLVFDAIGNYDVEINIPGIGKDTITANVSDGSNNNNNNNGGGQNFDPCLGEPGCVNSGGTEVFVAGIDTITEMTMVNYLAGAWDPVNNKVDTSYSGTVTITKVTGPGNVTGDLSVVAVKWGNGNIEIDKEGTYELEFNLTGIGKDTVKLL